MSRMNLPIVFAVGALAVGGCADGRVEPAGRPIAEQREAGAGAAGGSTARPVVALPSDTPELTPTPVPHELSIPWLRDYKGPPADLSVEETLEPGRNYSRHVASYLSDGLKIYALVTIPHGDTPPSGWPVVVFNHGYIPPAQYRTTERYVAYVDAFARNGYIVVKSDYRGHGSSEGEAAGGYGRPDYTVDVLNAVSAARRLPQADPDRIGMWGHSMGGHITLRSMVVTDTIKAGVIWAGVVGSYPDLFSRWHRRTGAETEATPSPRGRWRAELLARFGAPDENPQFWASLSANTYLEDLSGPLQLHHGTADSSVPVEFSRELYDQMGRAGAGGELHIYDGDDHNLSQSLGTALERSVEFFDKHVKASASGQPSGDAASRRGQAAPYG